MAIAALIHNLKKEKKGGKLFFLFLWWGDIMEGRIMFSCLIWILTHDHIFGSEATSSDYFVRNLP